MASPKAPRLTADGWIRAMDANRGEGGSSQPHLFHTEDGDFLVKVRNNPQGARVLVNELVSGLALDYLGVRHPRPAIVTVPKAVISDSPGAVFADGTPLASGTAFGSEYWQSDPGGAVDAKLITNAEDVAGTSAFDTWVRQHDSRQYRVRASEEPGRYAFIPVDNGHALGSPDWTVAELESHGVGLAAPAVEVGADAWRPALERLEAFSPAIAKSIVGQIPGDWLGDTERAGLIDYLVQRAPLAADAIEAALGQGGS